MKNNRLEKLAEARRLLSGQHEPEGITIETGYNPQRRPDPYWIRVKLPGQPQALFYFETAGDRDSIVKLYTQSHEN